MSTPAEIAGAFTTEQQKISAEIREIDLLIESTQTEINRMKAREDLAKTKVEQVRGNPSNYQREEIFAVTDEAAAAAGRKTTMEGQLAAFQAKRRLLDRVQSLIDTAATQLSQMTAPVAAEAIAIDDTRVLQAVVDAQEAERRRIARQVHDGPAQAMANVVLQSEISERLFSIDQSRAREELAGLRRMVNKTLQELRGFIFELRPMILDDLGLVPTLRRYIQTLVDKHGVSIDFSSNGRDRRLPADDEVAIFRLLQDSLLERIQRGTAKDIGLVLEWKEGVLAIDLHSDGKDLPADGELASGLRRSERLELLKGSHEHETRADGTVVDRLAVPIVAAPAMAS